jgi:hypothetical protein
MFGATQIEFGRDAAEKKPLLRELSQASVGHVWLTTIAVVLIIAWCILDSWNHDMNAELAASLSSPTMEPLVGYALTLAFLLFAFAAVVFLNLFLVSSLLAGEDVMETLAEVKGTMSDSRWPTLITTHFLSSILLQSLMMPRQMMSLGIFAATRAVEAPTAAAVRSKVFDIRFGGHSPRTIVLMFASTVMLVLWLCIQMTVLSGVNVGLIYTTDSFWAVAARGLRAVFWWSRELAMFYLTSSTYLSVARPNASLWSFVMLCGVTMGLAAIVSDRREDVGIKDTGRLSASV